MSSFYLPPDYIDASHGNPLFPFKQMWQLAAKDSAKNLTLYSQNRISSRLSTRYRAAIDPISTYFNERGFKKEGWSGVGYDSFAMLDGGTTRAFDLTMQAILDDVDDWNKTIAHQNKLARYPVAPIRPVIIMPSPTYGHFLRHLHNDQLKGRIECITFPRRADQNWAVDCDILKETIVKLNSEGKRVVAYFDSNPNNPTGYVRDREETIKIGTLLMECSDAYDRQDRKEYSADSAIEDLFEDDDNSKSIQPFMRMMWRGPSRRIQLIDDMVYDGLQYKDAPAPCSFSEALPDCKDWVTLIGPSKNGLASLRAGLVIANRNIISAIEKIDMGYSYCPSEMTMSLLSNYFNTAPVNKNLREVYQQRATTYYQFAGLFLKAMVNGIGSVIDEITPADIKKMRGYLNQISGVSRQDVTKLLNEGIDGLNISTSPQAGFFHVLDTSGLKGRTYNEEKQFCTNPKTIVDEFDISDVVGKSNFFMASGQYMGADVSECLQRVTFALPPEKLVQLGLRLRQMAENLGPAPA